jgi:NADPH:quinone reductase-like Zn-dependent oxidoreductase
MERAGQGSGGVRPHMKAAVYTRYGPPEVVVQIVDVEKPIPEDNEGLIRVCAASVNPIDSGLIRGAAHVVSGLRRPQIPGRDMAGQVEAGRQRSSNQATRCSTRVSAGSAEVDVLGPPPRH